MCSFAIAGALSPAIPTVGIVNWSTDLAELSEARLEFTLNDPAADEINRGSGGEIDVAGATHRALLLGLKAERTYTYRIVATGGGKVCTSADQTLTTGPPTNAPTVTRTANDPTAQARGFIVTCEFTGGSSQPRPRMAYIVDADGDVVWWTPEPTSCSRALIDWEGANMWMVQGTSGAANTVVQRIGMDGTGEQNVPELARAHHDIAALPGGIVATLVWVEGNTAMYGSNLVERLPDGTVKTVVRLDDKIFKPTDTGLFHANSILYHRADDTYTVGDAYGAYVKLTRQGRPLWQFARDCTGAPVPKCATGTLSGNHGHHLLANGNILFMNARPDVQIAPVYEYSLTETASTLTATRVWSYTAPNNLSSYALGDVQRLPNGNTLVTFSTRGQIHEISPSGGLVQAIAAATSFPYFAYADFRETLYGPPLR